MVIEEGHDQYDRILAAWDGKSGYVTLGSGEHFRVIKPDDDTVKFVPMGGIDNTYGSLSGGLPNG